MATIASLFFLWLFPVLDAQTALDHFWNDLKSFSADFSQSTFDDKNQVIRESRGHIDFVAPNRFHITDNHGQTIVADGQWVWIYDHDLNQVIRRPQSRVFSEAPAAILFRGKQLQEVYAITETGKKNGVFWYEAKPKQGESFDVIHLGFCENTLCQVEMQDAFGQKTVIHFLNVWKNKNIAAEHFVFHVPGHADVVTEE